MAWVLRRHDELARRARQRASYAAFLARRLDRRKLLRRAWAIARAAAARFGGLASSFIAGALRSAWAERRLFLAMAAAS